MQKQMGSVNREVELLRQNPKEMLKIKNTNRMKSVFDGLISSWDSELHRM
jgi:hypothetical protein